MVNVSHQLSRTPRWVPWAALGGAGALSAIGAPLPTVIARVFFVTVAGGALVMALEAVGRRAQLLAAGVLLALVVVQMTVRRPLETPPPSQWTVELPTPAERVRHTIALPLGKAQWGQWWSGASGAAVYVCARGPLEEADGLDLVLNDEVLGRITQTHAFGPRPLPTSVGFYRVPVTRAVLERSPSAVFELRRAAAATARPVEICGTFTYRPTAGLESSAFFDGARWTSPGPTQRGRYIVELRIERLPGNALVALY